MYRGRYSGTAGPKQDRSEHSIPAGQAALCISCMLYFVPMTWSPGLSLEFAPRGPPRLHALIRSHMMQAVHALHGLQAECACSASQSDCRPSASVPNDGSGQPKQTAPNKRPSVSPVLYQDSHDVFGKHFAMAWCRHINVVPERNVYDHPADP